MRGRRTRRRAETSAQIRVNLCPDALVIKVREKRNIVNKKVNLACHRYFASIIEGAFRHTSGPSGERSMLDGVFNRLNNRRGLKGVEHVASDDHA
jgi:hypothetical protein